MLKGLILLLVKIKPLLMGKYVSFFLRIKMLFRNVIRKRENNLYYKHDYLVIKCEIKLNFFKKNFT